MVSPCSNSLLGSPAILDADRNLQSRIVSQFAQSHHQALRKLAVEVSEGSVTLRGHVRWFYEKQLAIQHCQAEGARQLVDAVEVASAG
jgi:osmotically-inducible protein OsmY